MGKVCGYNNEETGKEVNDVDNKLI